MSHPDRRVVLKSIGATVGASAIGFSTHKVLTQSSQSTQSTKANRSSAQHGTTERVQPTVSINDGADLKPVLESVSDNDTVVLPQGEYILEESTTIEANNWTFNGNGSLLKTFGRPEIIVSGHNWDFGFLAIAPQNQTNPDAWCRVRIPNEQSPLTDIGSGNWKLHHLAWTRTNRTRYLATDDRRMGSILPGMDDGTSGEITDCWFGSGVDQQHGKSQIHCWNTLDGELWIRRSYFQGSGVYGANSSHDTIYNKGTTNFEDCYFEDAYLGAARTGGHFQDTFIRNCVITCTSLSNIPTRQGILNTRFRGVWAWHGPVIIENTHINGDCDLALDVATNTQIRRVPSIDYRSGELSGRISNSNRVTVDPSVGDEPKETPPESCVTSAEEAYLGNI